MHNLSVKKLGFLAIIAESMSIDKEELKKAREFLDEHFSRIKEWSLGDIKKACRIRTDGTCEDNGALVGAFILWCCAIDYFGGLLTANHNKGGTKRPRYEMFVNKYLSRYGKYDYEKLEELRWSLLHFYSPHHFALEHDPKLTMYHLKKSNVGCILHLGKSIEDLERAVEDYTNDMNKSPQLQINAWKYWNKHPIIRPLNFEKIKYTDEDCD